MKNTYVMASILALAMVFVVASVSATAGIYQNVNLVDSSNLVKGSLSLQSVMTSGWVYNADWGTDVKTYFWQDTIKATAKELTPNTQYKLISVIGTKPAICLASAKSDATGKASFSATGKGLFNEATGTMNYEGWKLNQKIIVVKSAKVSCDTGIYSNPILTSKTKI